MQHIPTLEVLKRAARCVACTRCNKRPPHSELFSPSIPRRCEPECTIFANLPKLAKIAYDAGTDPRAPVERQMRESICLNCHAHPSSGNDCELRVNRECTLSVYVLDLIEPFERVLETRTATVPHIRARVVV